MPVDIFAASTAHALCFPGNSSKNATRCALFGEVELTVLNGSNLRCCYELAAEHGESRSISI